MGANRIETQISKDLYRREIIRADSALSFPKRDDKDVAIATGLNHSNYAATSPARRPPFARQRSSGGQPKGSAGYFKSPSERKALNFIEQLAGFELTAGETFILGGLVVLASPVIAVGMLAGCGKVSVPEAPDHQQGREEDGGPSINHPPVLDPIGNKEVNENERLGFTLSAYDPDEDSLAYSAENLPAGASFDTAPRTFNWTPGFEQAGVYSYIHFEVTDGTDVDRQDITITVNNVNRPPVMDPISNQTVNENQLLMVNVSASDPDGDPLTFSGENLPPGATVGPTDGTLSWTPTFGRTDVYPDVGITATDGNLSTTRRFSITVNDANRAPMLDPIGDKVTEEGTLLAFTLSGADPDGDILIYSAVGLPAGASLDADTGQFNWIPTMAQVGNHVIAFVVSDGDLTDSEVVNIEVRGVREVHESRITDDVARSQHPCLVWTGMEYAVSWQDRRDVDEEIYFARIDSAGNKLGGDVRITNAATISASPSLVWTGMEYAVSWHDYRAAGWDNYEIYFARIDASGNKLGEDARITNVADFSLYPSLVWTGSEYGVSWSDLRDGNREIYFARIDASGNKIGGDVRITNAAADSGSPSLVWTGTEYGVSWRDERNGNWEIYFARIDASGNKIGGDVRITNAAADSGSPSLVWAGREYGVSWNDDRDGNNEIYFARIDASGNKIGSDVRITNNDVVDSANPSLVWSGSEYGMSWQAFRDGNCEIYFARIDASGNKIGGDIRITNNAADSWFPSLVYTGSEYGVSWQYYRNGGFINSEIRFARITGNFTPTP